MVSYESFYGGAPDILSPDYGDFSGQFGDIGKTIPAGQLSFSVNPMTANQIGEVVQTLKSGVKNVEIQLLGMDQQGSDQQVPIQHFKEMRALMKLSGVKPSVHGPLIDAAGFGQKGWEGKFVREDNERRMFDAIEKAHILDPNGNVPIVFHATNGVPGKEFRVGDKKEGEKRFHEQALGVINRDTGQVTQAKEHKTYWLRTTEEDFKKGEKDIEKGGNLMTARGMIDNQNAIEWDEKLKGIVADKSKVDVALGRLWENASALDLANINLDSKESGKKFKSVLKAHPEIETQMINAQVLQENNNLSFGALFDKAYRFGTDTQKKELRELSVEWKKKSKEESPNFFKRQMDASALQDEFFAKFHNITSRKSIVKNGMAVEDKRYGAPKIYQEVESFAMDKAAETFGNLAMKSYDEFGGNAPVIVVENMYQGMAFSRADDLKELVQKSRDNFTKHLMEAKNIGKSEANDIAEKQLGVTWDVGHLNMMKKKGFTDEDMIKETKKIQGMVKHVHLTDNFGYSDSHLVPGMGNVPFKKILEQLEKTGRLKEMGKVVEAGGFIQQFKKSAVSLSMAAFGSPIYGMTSHANWAQSIGMMGSYSGGYGTLNPSQHHSMYGAGFTTMPVELGGEMQGGQSRFGGTSMA